MPRLPMVAFAAFTLTLAACGKPPAAPTPGPAEVVVMTVAAEDVPESPTVVGRTVANRTVELRARVTGTLSERPYTEGAVARQGDVLFRLDPREFDAAVQGAEAQLAQGEAQLAKAQSDFGRIEPLAKAGAAPQTDLDAARAALLSAKAGRTGAEAQLARAKLDQEYATITAPFAGIVGKAAVDPGALVSPNSGTLAVLDQVDPMAVEFTVAEQELSAWLRDIASGRLKAPTVDRLPVMAKLIDGSDYPETGHIAFRDVRISPETGTALIRATFPNGKGLLRAGQFVRVTITGAVRVGALLVPQSAVLQSPTGASVLVLAAGDKVEARPVVLGRWNGTRWEIESGLKAGETVIVDGVQKARPGAVVKPVAATPENTPKPASGAAD